MSKRLYIFAVLFFAASANLFAQHDEHNTFHPHHSLALIVSHTQVMTGIKPDGDKKWLSLPSWGLDYNYKFHPKWAIGLHNDIVVEDFVVQGHGEEIERSYPIASAIMVSYKPGEHFSFMLGPGEEFAHTGNLFLIRAGIEYSCHISKGWELNAVITNDYKVNAYNSWAVGLGIAKIF